MGREQFTVAEVLERAADLIEPEGAWISGTSEGGCHCAWTAIVKAAGASSADTDDKVPGVIPFAKLIGAKSSRGIWQWNDTPGRTHAEVITALREAARLARGETL